VSGEVAAAFGGLGWPGGVVLGTYVLVGVVVVIEAIAAVDRSPDLRRTARRGSALAVTLGGSLVAALPLSAVIAGLWVVLGHLAPVAVTGWWADHRLVELIVCFVLWDLAAYAYHRVGHRTRVGWASHRVHHLGQTYDMGLVLRQPWFPVHGLVVLPWLALAGFSFEAAAVCSALSIGYQALQHTSAEWRWPAPLEAVLVSGRAHRHHHLVDGGDANLGAVFTVWDRLFGTHVPGPMPSGGREVADRASPEFGVGAPEPLNPLRIQLDGWLALRRPGHPSVPHPPSTHDGSVRHAMGDVLNHGEEGVGYQTMVPASCSDAISAASKPRSASTDSVSTPG
jgi:sterol desaturase/sphingolipid hydroxylase (fatty acid hydroxylase superfamily)